MTLGGREGERERGRGGERERGREREREREREGERKKMHAIVKKMQPSYQKC